MDIRQSKVLIVSMIMLFVQRIRTHSYQHISSIVYTVHSQHYEGPLLNIIHDGSIDTCTNLSQQVSRYINYKAMYAY